ncbi:RepB family DNA primase [Myxococcota bacterium]|nr:RepB family DNA primase [Myxococcota bacterium]
MSEIASRLDWNVYFGVATRRLPKNEFDRLEAVREPVAKRRRAAGGKTNLAQLSALWVDWDPSDDYIDDDDRRGHREAFEIQLETMAPSAPNLIVRSGAGLHAYWLGEEPIDVATPEIVRAIEMRLRGLCDYAGGDRAATDASRILRVPGTLNWPNAKKLAKGRGVAPCVIHKRDDGGRF